VAVAGLSARLYFDAHVNPRLVADLQRHSCDGVAATEIGHQRLSDEEHLVWATREGRVLVTFDLHDIPRLAAEWFHAGREHAGVILCVQPPALSYGELLRRLLALLNRLTAEELRNQVLWLDEHWEP